MKFLLRPVQQMPKAAKKERASQRPFMRGLGAAALQQAAPVYTGALLAATTPFCTQLYQKCPRYSRFYIIDML